MRPIKYTHQFSAKTQITSCLNSAGKILHCFCADRSRYDERSRWVFHPWKHNHSMCFLPTPRLLLFYGDKTVQNIKKNFVVISTLRSKRDFTHLISQIWSLVISDHVNTLPNLASEVFSPSSTWSQNYRIGIESDNHSSCWKLFFLFLWLDLRHYFPWQPGLRSLCTEKKHRSISQEFTRRVGKSFYKRDHYSKELQQGTRGTNNNSQLDANFCRGCVMFFCWSAYSCKKRASATYQG